MEVVIRADASSTIGSGHVMRCIALAEALRQAGADVSFICRAAEGDLFGFIESRGFRLHRLPGFVASGDDDAMHSREVIELRGGRPDWMIVDHYEIDHRWERALRSVVGRILVIDDLANRSHDCDILLDQNLVADMENRYVGKLPPGSLQLLGHKYSLLQPIYAELHERVGPREGTLRRILLYFGGADTENLTGRSLSAFLSLNCPDVEVDVVLSSAANESSLRQLAANHTNIHFHSNLATLAFLIARADLAVGAGGSTTWERLCLSLPSLVVTQAENQRLVAEELSRRGLIRWLGHQSEVDETALANALSCIVKQGPPQTHFPLLPGLDGHGAHRVCQALTIDATSPLVLRHARLEDEVMLLEWVNDPVGRRYAFSPSEILPATHRAWFRDRLRDPENCRIYIIESGNIAIGQVRFDRRDAGWEIDYSLDPIFRGRRLGARLLQTALSQLRADQPGALVLASIRNDNAASERTLESLGFTCVLRTEERTQFGRRLN